MPTKMGLEWSGGWSKKEESKHETKKNEDLAGVYSVSYFVKLQLYTLLFFFHFVQCLVVQSYSHLSFLMISCPT